MFSKRLYIGVLVTFILISILTILIAGIMCYSNPEFYCNLSIFDEGIMIGVGIGLLIAPIVFGTAATIVYFIICD